jgi:formate-dependent nitrite reductase membrane component NrfD
MKLCAQCHNTVWPYLIALFIAGVTAFLTWIILGYSDFDAIERILIAAGIFLGTSVALAYYMMVCMQRHCHHHHQKIFHRHNYHRHTNNLSNHHRPIGA